MRPEGRRTGLIGLAAGGVTVFAVGCCGAGPMLGSVGGIWMSDRRSSR